MQMKKKKDETSVINVYGFANIGCTIVKPMCQTVMQGDPTWDGAEEVKEKEVGDDEPTAEDMKRAIMATYKDGYWWSNRAWAVVYRVWQMKGYMNGYTQFAREVNGWGLTMDFTCNYDAVQKVIATGVLNGTPDKWVSQGAQGQAVRLAEALMRELEVSS
jgi:hypothetical protein